MALSMGVTHLPRQPRPDGVGPYVVRDSSYVLLLAKHMIVIAALPQGTVPKSSRLLEMLNEGHEARVITTHEEQMKMIRHEAVGENLEPVTRAACG